MLLVYARTSAGCASKMNKLTSDTLAKPFGTTPSNGF